MAAHAFLLCSIALLSALSRPALTLSDEELQPGLTYDEVPDILDRSRENPKQATRVTSSQDGEYGLESEEVILTPEDENPLRRILQPFKWHHAGISHSKRKLLQSLMGPYGPLSVSYNGKTCILFKAKRLAIRYRNHTFIDLTEKVFNPNSPVDTKGSVCTKEKATLSLKFGDVEDLRGLVISLTESKAESTTTLWSSPPGFRCPTPSTRQQVKTGSPWTVCTSTTTGLRRPRSTPARFTLPLRRPITASTSAVCTNTTLSWCPVPTLTRPPTGTSLSPISRFKPSMCSRTSLRRPVTVPLS
ncbi:ATPase H+ transporting accessory protein 1 like b isoform 2-T2 [Syngnathus typhle]